MADGWAVAGIGGLKQLRRRLRAVSRDLPSKVLTVAARKAAQVLAPVARRRAPRGATGGLRASVRPLASQRRASVAAGTKRVFYARIVHEGTGHRRTRKGAYRGAVKAQPFLDEALDAVTPQRIRRIYEQELRGLLREHRVI